MLSLREDRLGDLEGLAAELPAVLENRFRLAALDRAAARAAIVEPAGLAQGDELASPPLRFTEAALGELLDFLEGRSGIVEPFQLQVLCRHLERQAVRKAQGAPAGDLTIDAADLGGPKGMAAVLGGFYRDALAESVRKNRRWRLPRGLKLALLALLVLLAGVIAVLVITEEQRRRAELARAEAEGLIEFMVFDLRDKLAPIGRLDLLRDVQERIDAYYRHLGLDEDALDMQRRRMSALNNKGDTLLAQGDLVRAAEAYGEAHGIARRLATADPENSQWQRDLVVSLWKLGGEGLAEPEAARAYLTRALEILERLAAGGKLHGPHRDWPDLVRARLRDLAPPSP